MQDIKFIVYFYTWKNIREYAESRMPIIRSWHKT